VRTIASMKSAIQRLIFMPGRNHIRSERLFIVFPALEPDLARVTSWCEGAPSRSASGRDGCDRTGVQYTRRVRWQPDEQCIGGRCGTECERAFKRLTYRRQGSTISVRARYRYTPVVYAQQHWTGRRVQLILTKWREPGKPGGVYYALPFLACSGRLNPAAISRIGNPWLRSRPSLPCRQGHLEGFGSYPSVITAC
jgi:hypothetical protein